MLAVLTSPPPCPHPLFLLLDHKFQLGHYSDEDRKAEQLLDFLDCVEDIQCIKVQEDCCACNYGGKNVAINGLFESLYRATILAGCEDVLCPAVISSDPSCFDGVQAKCVNGQCKLVEVSPVDGDGQA